MTHRGRDDAGPLNPVFITGGTGYLDRPLITALLERVDLASIKAAVAAAVRARVHISSTSALHTRLR